MEEYTQCGEVRRGEQDVDLGDLDLTMLFRIRQLALYFLPAATVIKSSYSSDDY